jgi:hypothetical protein
MEDIKSSARTLCRVLVFDAKGCAYDQVAGHVVCLVVADVSFVLAPPVPTHCPNGLNVTRHLRTPFALTCTFGPALTFALTHGQPHIFPHAHACTPTLVTAVVFTLACTFAPHSCLPLLMYLCTPVSMFTLTHEHLPLPLSSQSPRTHTRALAFTVLPASIRTRQCCGVHSGTLYLVVSGIV